MENRMRVRRAELGITQLDLARKVNVSDSQISLVERGYVEPEPELRAALARALDTTPEAIFPGLTQSQAIQQESR